MSNSLAVRDYAQLGAMFGAVIFALLLFRAVQHRFFRDSAARLESSSETHIQILTALYGLLLGFVTVDLWQKQDDAEKNTVEEANQIRILSRTGTALGRDRKAMIDALTDYSQAIVYKDWPMMLAGQQREMFVANPELDGIWEQIAAAEPVTPAQQATYQEVVAHFEVLVESRQRRLLDSERSLPDLLRFALTVGAVLIVVCILLLKTEQSMSQTVLAAVTSGYLVLLIYLVFVLERPFSGMWRVTPEPYQRVLESLH
jgi:hypothetical protein